MLDQSSGVCLPLSRYLQNSRFSPEQASAMRTAYEEIVFALSHPLRRQVPSELAMAIARKVVAIAETGVFDRAEIVTRVFDDIGIRKPDAEQPNTSRGKH